MKKVKIQKRWNMQVAAATLPRKEFIARYLEHMTRTTEGRSFVQGWQVKKAAGASWVLVQTEVAGKPEIPARDADSVFERAFRGPLNYYVRQAEEFRERVHESPAAKRWREIAEGAAVVVGAIGAAALAVVFVVFLRRPPPDRL